ncbi:MAG: DUF1588 domain-containing protein [Myxococcota bacterium]
MLAARIHRLGCLLLIVGGCSGRIGDRQASMPTGPGEHPGPSSSPIGSPSPSPTPSPSDSPSPTPARFTCDPAARQTTPTPLRRMSVLQYSNTLSDLFAGVPGLVPSQTAADALAAMPADDMGTAFRGMDARLSGRHVQSYYDAAVALSQAIVDDDRKLRALAGDCALVSAPTAACVESFLDGFGLRAYRRPLSAEVRARYEALNDGSRDGHELFRALIFSILLAPEHLYHLEVDGPAAPGSSAEFSLSAYELASRLSFHFWQSMPDQALFTAAKDGSILTEAGYRAQAERVFADPRTKNTVASFYTEWLQTRANTSFRPSAAFGPFVAGTGLDEAVAARAFLEAAGDEIDALTAHYTWDAEGSFRDLLLSDLNFARSPALASIYGVAPWDGASEPSHLPSGERSGLLTRVSLLVSGTYTTHPIHRGAVVRKRLLCDSITPPDPSTLPPGSLTPPAPDPSQTTRQRFANKVANEPCASCHKMMNPIGYVLEHYDAIGRYRTTEHIFDPDTGAEVNALPIDAAAAPGLVAGDTTVIDSGAALSQMVADSGRVEACFARQYFRYTFHRDEVAADSCTLEDVRVALTQGNLRQALLAIALSPSFKTRKVE